jgi:cellulose biosynthesis protein BcsQ
MMGADVDRQPGKVVAFYSFKGGTGRSMALANAACLLAARSSRPVLVVDWDLEAPGLHRYFGRELFKAFKGSEQAQRSFPGLIDLFMELRGLLSAHSPQAPAEEESAAKLLERVAIEDFVIPTDRPNLHLLKAGAFDDEYAAKVSGFDWQAFYASAPSLLRALSERLATLYEWVLIDSRTGLTDTSGICTMLMPETLVVVFTPNRQSVEGAIDLVRQAAKHRSGSDDLRPLIVYPLPSRIEASEPALRSLWRHGGSRSDVPGYQVGFEQAFAEIYQLDRCDLTGYFDEVQVQHVPRYAYGEDIAVLAEESRDRFSLTRSFERFVDRLAAGPLPWEETGQDVRAEPVPDIDRSSASSRAATVLKGEVDQSSSYLENRTRSLMLADRTLVLATLASSATLTVLATLQTGLPMWVLGVTAVIGLVALSLREVMRLPHRLALLVSLQLELKVVRRDIDQAPELGDIASWRQRVNEILARSPVDTGVGEKTNEPAHVFISYRRDDSHGMAGRLFDDLVQRLGSDRVFMDIDSIAPGENYVETLSRQVAAANIVLAVMGPDWLGSRDSEGRRRLDNPSDLVRTELALALERGLRVIPVLVNGAEMPAPDELPDALRPLVRLQAVALGTRTWSTDFQRLAAALGRYSLATERAT